MKVIITVKNMGTITAENIESITHNKEFGTIYIKHKFYVGKHYKLKDIKNIQIMED